MKKLLTLAAITVVFCRCTSSHTTELQVDNKNRNLQIVHHTDSFERSVGQYRVYTMIKNVSKHQVNYVQVTAKYFDEANKEITSSIGGPGRVLPAGDSAIVCNSWLFPTLENLPYKVVISVSDISK